MEGDCCAELVDLGQKVGVAGWCRSGDGWVEFCPTGDGELERLARVSFSRLVFARQWLAVVADPSPLPAADRAKPLAQAAARATARYSALRVEHTDSETGRPLARLARALQRPVERALGEAGVRGSTDGPVVHVVLTRGDRAFVGLSDPANSASWPGGIPRLRVPKAAPSRSVVKLEEALQLFLSDEERSRWLRPGRRVVDLGAAPGGWSWYMAERGLSVEAIDRARLASVLVDHPRVTHRRRDGFRYRPRGTVDWLLCDMVERPHRIAELAAGWLERADCHHALFNLKLPMKQRWRSLVPHLRTVGDALPPEGRLHAKQLYHDRDEVSVFASRLPALK
jgi:23S rRNA (cytidine2498-2'-O)-methyltransferase